MKKKINVKKLITRLIILIVIGVVIVLIYKKLRPAETTEEIMTATAAIGNVESMISGTGTLSPANQYEVKSLVKGSILQAPFEEGDLVKSGSLLYQISTKEIANNVKVSELSLQKAKNAYQELLDKQAKLQMTSKASGYIKKLYVTAGETIPAGKVIADIYNSDILYLDLLFPSEEASSSWIGKNTSIGLDATDEAIKGVVTAVSDMEEVMDGGILGKKVTIRVENVGGLKAGDGATATVGDIPSNNTGTFRVETETTIVAETEGVIGNLYIKEGQWLSKGDQVLDLTSKDLASQIENAAMSVTEAEISLETLKTQESQYTINSPITGSVIIKNKKKDDTIDPSADTQSGPMAIIYDMSYLTFTMNIDELQISTIKKGQKVAITSEAFPEESFEGVIERINLKGNTNNGVTSYPVVVKVESFGSLLPGMNITGKIIIEQAENVLTVPSSALQAGDIIYLQSSTMNEDPSVPVDPSVPEGFIAVPVTIGINDGSNVEIKEGLKEGDVVYVPFDSTVEMPDGYYYY